MEEWGICLLLDEGGQGLWGFAGFYFLFFKSGERGFLGHRPTEYQLNQVEGPRDNTNRWGGKGGLVGTAGGSGEEVRLLKIGAARCVVGAVSPWK